jgi:hypothetical protein
MELRNTVYQREKKENELRNELNEMLRQRFGGQ